MKTSKTIKLSLNPQSWLSAGIQMLYLLVPIVISYLREPAELARAPAHVHTMHDYALQWLTKIGPKYPQEFKTLMSQSPALRDKLKCALTARQTREERSQPRNLPQPAPAQPAITLRTDFSGFT